MTIARSLALLAAALPPLLAQPPKPFTAQAASTISYTTSKDGDPVVEINNVDYDVSGEAPPGRPAGSRLVLRKTTHSRQVIGDMGIESTVTLEAWPLGAALQSKPLYSLKPKAIEAHTIDNAFWLVDRTTDPDVAWWSVYQLGTGKYLFDTYTDLLRFTVSRANGDPRYAGLEVPPDDSPDPRLKEPHVLAILCMPHRTR